MALATFAAEQDHSRQPHKEGELKELKEINKT